MGESNSFENEIDPDKREWEYDGDGTKIYKVESGYPTKTVYEEVKQRGLYHRRMDNTGR